MAESDVVELRESDEEVLRQACVGRGSVLVRRRRRGRRNGRSRRIHPHDPVVVGQGGSSEIGWRSPRFPVCSAIRCDRSWTSVRVPLPTRSRTPAPDYRAPKDRSGPCGAAWRMSTGRHRDHSTCRPATVSQRGRNSCITSSRCTTTCWQRNPSPTSADRIGWRNKTGNRGLRQPFHYYRLTDDNRIVWGGYDAILPFRRPRRRLLREPNRDLPRLAEHSSSLFPPARRHPISHRWAGAIDTNTRFCRALGPGPERQGRLRERIHRVGVAADEVAADVCLDLLEDVRRASPSWRWCARPVPFPARAVASMGIPSHPVVARSADHNAGRRNGLLRALVRARASASTPSTPPTESSAKRKPVVANRFARAAQTAHEPRRRPVSSVESILERGRHRGDRLHKVKSWRLVSR